MCEIEPVIPPASTRFFGNEDYHVALDPRTHIVFDDARHYLLTTTEKFDIIASDPLDVFIKGHGRALFQGVLRIGKAAPESGRNVHAVRSSLRDR